METVFLDGRAYQTGHGVHLALKRLLRLPSYYGCNADALYDCLSERAAAPALVVMHMGDGQVAETMEKVIRVFETLGSGVKRPG